MIKVTAVGIVLAVMLLASAISNVSYADVGIKVVAKQKQDMILLMVKNARGADIYTIKVTLLDGNIKFAKVSQEWKAIKGSDPRTVTLTTTTDPIKANDRKVFLLDTNDIGSIISLVALDRFGSTIAKESTRTVFKQTLSDPNTSDKEPTYISNARSFTITTDKIFYSNGDKMFISGTLDPNSSITITIYTPSGQKLKIVDATDQTGSFNALHLLRDAESGTYRLKVKESSGYAETTFKVL